ncbi:MAG: DUF5319 family protein [Actinomycetota bacterium]
MEEPQEEEQPQGLDSEERANIEADLEDLGSMRGVFAAQSVRGVVIACPDCNANHYYDWDLLRENLEHMLEFGEPRMHEPAFEPKEDDYVQWDYGKGYIDALSDAGLEADRRVELTSCPWCQTPLDEHYGFCPRCGRNLAPVRLYHELRDRGMTEREARAVMVRAGFEPF